MPARAGAHVYARQLHARTRAFARTDARTHAHARKHTTPRTHARALAYVRARALLLRARTAPFCRRARALERACTCRPRAGRAQVRRQEVCGHNPHFCLALPYGNAPRRSLVSNGWGFEFRQVWKVASSSLA
eukprot:5788596-Pleurochrysis_carterae.AAC.1